MERRFLTALTLLLLALTLLACAGTTGNPPAAVQPTTAPAAGGQATTAPAAGGQATAAPTSQPAPPGATKIAFWHSQGGDVGGKVIPQMISDFNASGTNCFAEATYQGTYDDALNKLKAGLQSNNVPAVMQLYDIGTQLMVDLKAITPMQDFIDKDKYDTSQIEPNLLAYYTVNNRLYSMPFNTSQPILYYNKDAFKAAGLDPEKPPRTFDEVEAAAKKLTVKDASGNVTQYGASFAIYGWFFEQWMASSAALYADNGNGRDGRATAVTFNDQNGQAIVNWWKKMFDEGVLGNYGRTTADTRNAFTAGKTAMIVESTATLRGLLDATKGKFELGTGVYPRPNEDAFKTAGPIIGGASLWILNGRPAEEQQCAWQLVQFLSSPKEQAYWHINSGYFPTNKQGYDDPTDQAWRKQYPQFQTAVDQLHATSITRPTQGALLGVFPQSRQTVEVAIESVITGKAQTKDALDKAVSDVNAAIQQYNLTTGK